jgi:serine/threonine protein kinase/WD40 repeat protein
MFDDPSKARGDARGDSRVLRLFAAGSELPPAERAAFLEEQCGGDDALRREVAELLEIESGELGVFLATPAVAGPPTLGALEVPAVPAAFPAVPAASSISAGDLARVSVAPRIAGYEDFELIAQGGMGAVFRARQLAPVRRTVAVKIIRPGADSGALLRRFEAERQALALMSHPFIAAVHDAGVDELGRPYIAMEYVDGSPIHEHCARERLSLEERLALFVEVCEGVDHAHRRGVLHRDLKPSNVLVCRAGDRFIPKLIDFGIAKALEGSLGEQSLHTLEGTLLGTPEYMSPERLEGPASRVDTRSDVYALGVMLYELLAQARPIAPERLADSGIVKLHKILSEEEPPKPSERLSELLATGSEAAASLADPARWVRRLEGDLDWVVMKALAKEPELRFRSAHELAADIENFLADRPVSAGPPSGLYRARKFARRHRAQVVAAALVLLSLVVGLFGTLWFLAASLRSEADAEQRATEAEQARRKAEGSRLAIEAAMLAEEKPNQALLLALEAAKLTDAAAVHQTIHVALPHQSQVAQLVGHDYGTRQALYLADGRLLTRGVDPFVCLWDPDTQALVRRFGGDGSPIVGMALDDAQTRLATVAEDGTARVWSLENGEGVACATKRDAKATAVAISPDGARCAVGSADGVAVVFDASSGAVERELTAPGACVLDLAFDPSGRRLALRSLDSPTQVLDADTGALWLELAPCAGRDLTGEGDASLVRFSPRGEWILNTASNGGRGASVDTLAGERVLELAGARNASFVGDDRLFFARDGGFGFATLTSGEVVEHRWPAGEEAHVLEASPDGRLAVAVDQRNDLCIVDLARARIVRRLRGESDKRARFVDVAFHPDGARVATTGQTLRVWRIEPEFAPFDVPGDGLPFDSLALAAGDQTLVLARSGPKHASVFELWSLERRERLAAFEPGLRELLLSPRADRLVGIERAREGAPESESERAIVFDLGGRSVHALELPPRIVSFEMWPDGRQFAVSHGNPRAADVTFYDLESGAALDTIQLQFDAPAARSHVTPNEAILRREHSYSSVVFDRRTGELVARALGPDRSSHTLRALSPDGRTLLVVDGGLKAWGWRLADGRAGPDAIPLARYRNLVFTLDWAAGFAERGEGRELAWVKCANEVHLFDPATATPFSVIRLEDACAAVAPSADGRALITVTKKGRCQRWPLDTVALARRLAVGCSSARDLENFQVGTPEERRAREKEFHRGRLTPNGHAQLGELALGEGDLDEAIACYERAWDLQPLRFDFELYLRAAELLCRRSALPDRAPAETAADRARAVQALEQALRFGASQADVAAVPGVERLRGEPGAEPLLPGSPEPSPTK